jgi:hypothetical protein
MTTKGHRQIKLFVNHLKDFSDTRATHGAQSVQKGTTDITSLGTKRAGLEYILTATDTAIHMDFDVFADRIDNRGQTLDAGLSAVELPPAMVADDQRIGATVQCEACVFGILDAFED